MKRIAMAATAIAASAGAASAGGIDRSGQPLGPLFETGTYVEGSVALVSPSISGVATAASPTPGGASGDMAPAYFQSTFGYKRDLRPDLAFALLYDQPFGADVEYPVAPYFATGSTAQLDTHALTAVLKYRMPSNVSVYGGVRYQTMEATASIPFVAGYTATGERDGGVGYMVGAAYEKPEIALRIALTYNSRIQHDLVTTEAGPGALVSTTTVKTPQSINLDFQTGVAADTLLFGSVRWVEWSKFDITPAVYLGATGGSLVSYANDTITYSIGLGRKLNENWAVAGTLGYEPSHGGFSSNLGPTDGKTSIGVGATYTNGPVKITGGVSYTFIGDAQTTLGGGVAAANFTDNHALAAGVKIGYRF
ncbi:MAG: hypothetical protein D6688_12265 [Alphaproteobacteria bacterium]|nr:MAG: hypothetical protein D6688_12265 [Alphaproteobacteria bacterium]